jgi:GDP-L-fucose synthase
MLEDNVLINTNVLHCAHIVKVKKLIACLSTCIFPDNTSYPINETMLQNGPPHESNEGYAYAKRLLEIQCKTYNKEYNCNYICVIPTNIYGSFDNFNLDDSHVIPGLIHRCYLAKKTQTKFIVKGTGKPLRQFIYSTDVAKLIMMILESGVIGGSYILSPTEEYSILDIANMIMDSFDYHDILFDDSFSDGQYRKTADNSKLKKLVDFEFIDLNTGIKNTIDWFTKNYNTLRK